MNRWRIAIWVLLCLPAAAAPVPAGKAERRDFSFVVIAHLNRVQDETSLREAIDSTDHDNLAFVLVNGIKQPGEPCSDTLYEQRLNLLDSAKNGLVVSLAASDWTACTTAQQNSASMERLNRLRELLFENEFSLGASRLPLLRQSAIPKFSSYTENARWEIRNILFATLNLPANNNNYLSEAGRNSEFEDRQIANREWLQRLFALAQRKKMPAIVLFADSDPMAPAGAATLFSTTRKRDGYLEVRRQITILAADYKGKVLIVHGQPGAPVPTIAWQKNIGSLAAGQANREAWLKLTVHPAALNLFVVSAERPEEKIK